MWRSRSYSVNTTVIFSKYYQMYTANTMASATEALGMSLPGSSSFPAEYPEKMQECESTGRVMRNLLEKNILPRDIMTRSAFENAMVCTPKLHIILIFRLSERS